jgi:alpha-ketoglutarate-dependent taurine dioxygenase
MLIENAAPRIGAIVTATDVRSLTEGDWKRLYQTWLDRYVLVVRGQRLSKPEFISYSRRFGRLKPHRVKSTRDPEHPEITLMGVTTGNSANDKLVLDRGQGWHTDGPWDVEICRRRSSTRWRSRAMAATRSLHRCMQPMTRCPSN